MTHANGDKLSKLTGAPAISLDSVSETLCAALDALQQQPVRELAHVSVREIWSWARENWQLEKLTAHQAIVKTS